MRKLFRKVSIGCGDSYSKRLKYICYIPKSKVPQGQKISYVKPVATIKPKKSEVNRVRLMAGVDKLNYPCLTSTDQASLTTTKFHLNNIISTRGAQYLTVDIRFIYYSTPFQRFKYVRVQLLLIPDDVVG